MKQFLLDSDICIFALRGVFDLDKKVERIGTRNCFLSEITVAELKYGAEKSGRTERHRQATELFVGRFEIITVLESLDIYALEKARLERLGTPLDDFDLLIGSTAIRHGLTLVTNNVKHFDRMENLAVENWTTKTV